MSTLRQQIKRRRRALPVNYQWRSGQRAARQLQRHFVARQWQRVGLYQAAFGELPTLPIAYLLSQWNKTLYLPQVHRHSRQLTFVEVSYPQLRHQRMPRHSLGMYQPAGIRPICVSQLDVIIVPLVAIDKMGNRMGMGGGYYDTTLAHAPHRPLRIGWAYDFQLVSQLSTNPWDQSLDMLVTPTQTLRFSR